MPEILAFASPFAVGAIGAWRRPGTGLSWFLVMGYAYPLMLLVALANPDFSVPTLRIAPATGNYLRVMVHVVAGAVLLGFVARRGRLRAGAALPLALLTVCGMALSVAFTAPGLEAAGRAVFTFLPVVNLFLLVPSVATREEFFTGLARAGVALAVCCVLISVLVIARHGFFPAWSTRLGRPFGPTVLSYLLVTAFGLSFLASSRLGTRAFLAGACIAAASRLDAGLTLGFAAWGLLRRGASPGVAVVGLITAMAAGVLVFQEVQEQDTLLPANFQRSDFGSGRGRLWAEGWELAVQAPWAGRGDRAYLERAGGPLTTEEQRVHNMPLEMAMSYGFPTALMSLSVYLVLIAGIARRADVLPAKVRTSGLFLGLVAVAHAMLTTASWVNLGDGPGLFLLVLLAAMASFPRHGPAVGASRLSVPEPSFALGEAPLPPAVATRPGVP